MWLVCMELISKLFTGVKHLVIIIKKEERERERDDNEQFIVVVLLSRCLFSCKDGWRKEK